MITTFKERPSGGFYCSECRMSFGELHTTCPYCGSFVSNYEELLVRQEPPDIIIGGRWWKTPVEEIGPPLIDEETYNKIISMVRRKEE